MIRSAGRCSPAARPEHRISAKKRDRGGTSGGLDRINSLCPLTEFWQVARAVARVSCSRAKSLVCSGVGVIFVAVLRLATATLSTVVIAPPQPAVVSFKGMGFAREAQLTLSAASDNTQAPFVMRVSPTSRLFKATARRACEPMSSMRSCNSNCLPRHAAFGGNRRAEQYLDPDAAVFSSR
jgi:hypothetical protein